MAVPSDTSVFPEKMQQYLARPADILHHPNRQWQLPDERDGFIFWLRGEFAAANAIIDSLCHHLRTTAEPADYDFVINCIQQRRVNWTPVLSQQPYFSIADVTMALQQVAWQKQHRRSFEHPKPMGRDSRRPSFGHGSHGHNGGNRFEGGREIYSANHTSPMAKVISDKTGEKYEKVEYIKKRNDHVHTRDQRVPTTGAKNEGKGDNLLLEGGLEASSKQDEKTPLPPKVFCANEMCDGKMVNAVEGLKLYEGLFDNSEIAKMLSMANELRMAGKRRDLQGQTFIASKRPGKGHGREVIQLGVPMHDGQVEDETLIGLSRERKVEAIPSFFQDIFVRLVQLKVLLAKPDFCIIDFYNEGEYSHPHAWPPSYGRPVTNLALTECEMVFGRTIHVDKGECRGPLRLSLAAGSLLLAEGKSVDLAKRAISALHKPRIVLTFGKAQSKRPLSSDVPRVSSATAVPLPLGPLPGRLMNYPRRPPGSKHYGVVPTSSVLQATHCRPQQLSPSNGIQPLFVTQTPVTPSVVPFPVNVSLAPTSNGWTVSAQPRQPAPSRPPFPGTGVFLPPPGSSPVPLCQQIQSENSNSATFSSELCSESDDGAEKSHPGSGVLLKDRGDGSGKLQNQNGNSCSNIATGDREEQATALKKTLAKSDAAEAAFVK